MDLSQSQTPLLVGRSVAALVQAEGLIERTGSIQWVENLVDEFDLYDEKRRPSDAKICKYIRWLKGELGA